MDEYYCTNCNAILNNQSGFDPKKGVWCCTVCGETLMADDVFNGDTFEGVAWFCDNCDALLNRQSGFTDRYETWTCTECGHVNGITESDIVNRDQAHFTCPSCGSDLDSQFLFSKYERDWKCTECGARLRHGYDDDEYIEMRHFCPNCDAPLDVQSCFSEYDDEWECTECGIHLHHDRSDDSYSRRYVCPSCDASLDLQSYFSERSDDWECTECGARLHREYSDDEYIEMRHFCPNCDAPLDVQSCFSEYDDEWECTECSSKLHHDYLEDEYTIVEEGSAAAGDAFVTDDTSSYDYQPYEYFDWPYPQGDGASSNDFDYGMDYSKPSISITAKKRSLKALLICSLLLVLVLGGVGLYHELSLLIPVGYSSEELIGQHYETVQIDLERSGFSNVSIEDVADLPIARIAEDGMVTDVKIGSAHSFDATSKYPSNFPVEITYHSLEHLSVPLSPKEAKGMNYEDVTTAFKDAGFENVTYEIEYDIITGWLTDVGEVESISINGDKKFSGESTYRADADVVITYHELRKNRPK